MPPFGQHQCATYVREALEAGGLVTIGHPAAAKDWGPTLVRIGFRVIDPANYSAALGDVIVIQGTSMSKSGHIEIYDGKNWISDFVQQHGMWPGPSYRAEKPSYKIYRCN